ncbi:hypothetical protein ABKS89_07630 [Pseudomonas sp. LABIM340]|uniref:Uncharacterized protein n=1 Tax=Pseudomonas nitroreducens TaxID=46680 RepID=A0A5R9A1S3_PSENT|nr:hypothetical protein [Pseudomonas nitroreducens]TLP72618.1 hypothetical protein FEA48_20365 [Pseudomonas nitroreducens]
MTADHLADTLAVLRKLAQGIDPRHDAPLAVDDPCQAPEVIRALFHAIHALEVPAPKPRALPQQAGKPWQTEEEAVLMQRFEAGETVAAIAREHGRTTGGIRSRLKYLGKL